MDGSQFFDKDWRFFNLTDITEMAEKKEFFPEEWRFLNLIDLDHMFGASPNAIILNKIDYTAPDYVRLRNAKVYARSGELNFVAHCDCEEISGNQYIGIVCSDCGTIVKDDFSTEGELEHNTWLSMPSTIKGVLHPVVYLVLSSWLARKGASNLLDCICDPDLDLHPKYQSIVLERGHNYLYHNFDNIMHYLIHVDKDMSRKKNTPYIEQFIKLYRDVLFCTKLPVMSSVLHSVTSVDGTAEGRQYADAGSQAILDAATDLATLDSSLGKARPNSVSTVVQRVYKSYIAYVSDIAKSRLSKKKSLIRRHMLGTRLHFSFRTVIIPHMNRYDELYLPWSIAVNLLKIHIIGRLMNQHGMYIGDAVARQVTSLMNYDELIHQIMKDLIAESKFPGLPVLWNRNPSLRRGAIQRLFFTRVKTDLSDDTVSMSTLILKDPNADRLFGYLHTVTSDADTSEKIGILVWIKKICLEQFLGTRIIISTTTTWLEIVTANLFRRIPTEMDIQKSGY
jgi:hypothetical protein